MNALVRLWRVVTYRSSIRPYRDRPTYREAHRLERELLAAQATETYLPHGYASPWRTS